MKTRIVKLIFFASIAAVVVSLLTVGYLTARPGDSPSGAVAGTLSISGGFERLGDKVRFYSDKTSDCSGGCNVIAVSVVDADLSTTRTGTVVYQNIQAIGNAAGVFQILSGDGVSTGANVAGVLQGETGATRKFTGDNFSVVFPLTTTFGTVTAPAGRGVSAITFGRPVLDRDGDGAVTGADVDTGDRAFTGEFVSPTGDLATFFPLTTVQTDNIAVAAGATSIVLSNTPADLNGDFVLTVFDIISATFTAGGAPTNLPLTGTIIGAPPSVTFAAVPAGGTVTVTYRVYSADLVNAATFTLASPLTYAEARATFGEGNWGGKIPRDSGLGRTTPAADGAYNPEDLRVVVDGRTPFQRRLHI